MFRVLDDRPGSRAEVSVARPGPLLVRAHVRATADAADLTALRVLLTADVLFRAAEVGGLQVLVTRAFTGESAGKADVERAAAALSVHPPAADLAVARPEGMPVVHVADDSGTGEDDHGGILIRAAAARLAKDARPGGAAAGAPGGQDPLAIRLALMSLPRRQPAELTAGMLADATRTLGEWRRRVARWAESPSGAIPKPAADTIREAFGNLDTVAVVALLNGLAADETLPPGPRFETFLYADRVLGLNLPRDIGR
ncbi:MAG TPA: hypothetical protein VIZ43_04900 [Trebonia sp.]